MIIFAGVAEYVIIFTVPVQIEATLYFIPWSIETYFSFYFMNLWMHELWCILPSAIEVRSCDIAPKISINNSIYIDHRIYFEDVMIQKPICILLWFWNQPSDHTLNHVRWPYLARMLPSWYYNHFFLLFIWSPANCNFRHIVSTYCRWNWFYSKL